MEAVFCAFVFLWLIPCADPSPCGLGFDGGVAYTVAMKGIKLANLVVLATGLGLLILGIALIIVGSGGGGGDSGEPVAEPQTDAEWLAAGENLVKQYNCNFCHRTEVPKDKAHLARDNCQQCHQFHNRPENLAPPLEYIAERRPEEWIRRYLRYPYRIRQNQSDRMPDLGLSDREVNALTRYLVIKAQGTKLPDWKPTRETQPDAERLAKGKALWDKYTCGACHTLGDHQVKPSYDENGNPQSLPVVFAPDLSMVWTRTRPEWL
ncbi:MAG: c-type cytochrome, partial [Planctomycetes bacterium]|nr:c-type cytochrome [Planctomycetota bacterium]